MSDFIIYPAIDMRDGKCVRLVQGDYNQETIYGDSPFEMAKSFAEAGAKWIHMVDLDGAKAKKRVNHEFVIRVAQELDVSVQIGGGIRTAEDVAFYLEAGVDRVILGSVAVQNPAFTKEMLAKYGGDKIVIGIDARDGYVATEGWLETSSVKAEELGKELARFGAEVFIFTDISRDGMLSGPNTEAIVTLAKATGKEVIASGGVSNLKDLQELRASSADGVAGAIVGKALYTNQFTLAEALTGKEE
ncbi:1-(5-phosphoribosyl)-5-[(5-phosphoribosylamino)methylideneamino] imidazole-4-carboxamide isomerase [Alkalihalobacillus alcalophilus ATCC 27647 = CGMCC 1.3604]|uniref:1-(5-phosphoribosyl)-5-[(5-phosphoribosylamino)methylideneamino] imidazole-4-carboxamide isomerase n=1 Tax=Alkalihalobacillus alcalophilus ATCC 27647 = CGMCC 1.3604 TaxID=1218173 RepID=A0A094WNK3_ALKAL|nr:1-(5-phosphoribosyl)-5-[(5-phosphoribosylamino)methylideneamino]imidazole-4-carboxamide isomerase [Alkalihalobacillus alcalophilus]KGA97553.1 1-(5-phosphoribosyl)-5-[(5-phosphoribosylamino)methylideneamino] imidazole-4-carboxamide isomerase [Alkalihalobacillus alcalophilus ATCC 27647 = CGMCC 1.3604]MED1562983.1 1-(5-phosphoribosyl)-5-[(5-phosphoribosylamino)methylideneamino]imidazole-4-carboxamide isomerase [Alkalihalobacillus alcalophilus]THG91120.1 1-(5-phosphoribosyl)-5-[(5-phosphoribosyla